MRQSLAETFDAVFEKSSSASSQWQYASYRMALSEAVVDALVEWLKDSYRKDLMLPTAQRQFDKSMRVLADLLEGE